MIRDATSGRPLTAWLAAGTDLKVLGLLFVVSGGVDLAWILAYPAYALTVFGATLDGWIGWAVKLQHPVIHGAIGLGFWRRARWAFWTYLVYLALACASETVTQLIDGYHQMRTGLIAMSLLFGAYILWRRPAFA